jgi:hypothetical protein
LTPDTKTSIKLSTQARFAAERRLKKLYANDFSRFEKEERVLRGLPAEKSKSWSSVKDMRNYIAELEARLGATGVEITR